MKRFMRKEADRSGIKGKKDMKTMKRDISKRMGVFFCQPVYGYINGHIDLLLEEMQKHCCEIRIVVGDILDADGRRAFERYSKQIIADKSLTNSGLGYQAAVSHVLTGGSSFDEIVFFDDHLVGPVDDLAKMFMEMAAVPCDFWSVLSGRDSMADHFLVIREEALSRINLSTLWAGLSNGVWDSLSNRGFRGERWIRTDDLQKRNTNVSIFYPKELIRDYGCPFFLMDAFISHYGSLLKESLGESAIELFRYLTESKIYDPNLLLKWLIRFCHQSDLVKSLHLDYLLSDRECTWVQADDVIRKRKIALLIHIFRTDMAAELADYALHMPAGTDIYVTTDKEEKARTIRGIFRSKGISDFHIIRVVNRGRDVSSKLVGMKQHMLKYDYVCCIHDKMTPHLKPQSVGNSFGYKCFQNIIPSKAYVLNIIKLFEDNPLLGMAVPPEPNHAGFYPTLGNEWVGNYQNVADLAARLDLHVPIAKDKEPVAPFGSFFWIRPGALKKLYAKDWKYTDFPEEPIGDDATILHAIERIYPFVVQDAGYYTAVVMSDFYARNEYINLKYYLRGFNRILFDGGILAEYDAMCNGLMNALANVGSSPDSLGRPGVQRRIEWGSVSRYKQEVQNLENSLSWRLTAPIRLVLDLATPKSKKPQMPDISTLSSVDQLNYYKNRAKAIRESVSWRITAPIRSILDKTVGKKK